MQTRALGSIVWFSSWMLGCGGRTELPPYGPEDGLAESGSSGGRSVGSCPLGQWFVVDTGSCKNCMAGEFCAGGQAGVYQCHAGQSCIDGSSMIECETQGAFSTDPRDACQVWTECPIGTLESSPPSATRDRDCVGSDWTMRFGSDQEDQTSAVAVSPSGNAYVVGWTSGEIVSGAFVGHQDAFIRKVNVAGLEVWTQQFGTTEIEWARAVAVDEEERIYVAGFVGGELSSGGYAGDFDAYLRSYDADGVVLWTRQFGTNGTDEARDVAIDENGDIYVVGESSLGSPESGFCFLRKYDAQGELLWTDWIGVDERDSAIAVATDHDSGVFVIGTTYGALVDEEWVGNTDVYVRKYDLDGRISWTEQIGSSSFETAVDVGTDSEGNVYALGKTLGALYGDARQYDGFIWKGDSEGTMIWGTQLGSAGDDHPYGIATSEHGAYVVGSSQFSTSAYSGHVWFLTAQGQLDLDFTFEGVFDAGATAAALDDQGNLYVSGREGVASAGLDAAVGRFSSL